MVPARSSGRGSKRRRISRSAEFERVYRQGRSYANRWFVVYAFPRAASEEAPRLGLSVSRRVGGAVERNRVKRLVREAFWAEADRLAPDADYVVVARPDARLLGDERGLTGVREALNDLLDRHREPNTRRRRASESTDASGPGGSVGSDVSGHDGEFTADQGPAGTEGGGAPDDACLPTAETVHVSNDGAKAPTGDTGHAARDTANAPTAETLRVADAPALDIHPEDR